MRSIGSVIDAITLFVPEEETVLRHDLNSITTSVQFAPPELTALHWERLAEALHNAIGAYPESEWQYAVLALFSAIPVSQIRKEVLEHKANNPQQPDNPHDNN